MNLIKIFLVLIFSSAAYAQRSAPVSFPGFPYKHSGSTSSQAFSGDAAVAGENVDCCFKHLNDEPGPADLELIRYHIGEINSNSGQSGKSSKQIDL